MTIPQWVLDGEGTATVNGEPATGEFTEAHLGGKKTRTEKTLAGTAEVYGEVTYVHPGHDPFTYRAGDSGSVK
jgi:hypothetical protein